MSDPVTREEIHQRRLDLRFFARSDGLFEAEGRLVDTKRQAFRRQLATEDSPPGAALHDIVVRLVVDASLVVQEATASYAAAPFGICPGGADALQRLRGQPISAGWNKRVRDLLGGVHSCTHIVEMLGTLASTVHQGMAPERLAQINEPHNEAMRRSKVDSCFAYAAHREVVARLWPQLHSPLGTQAIRTETPP